MDHRLFIGLIFLASLPTSRGQVAGCREGRWQCDDGRCISAEWKCDGQGDCLDGSDEMDCPAHSASTNCPPGQFACVDSVGCVDESARCDGQNQCPTGSDEENCPASENCLNSEWMCRNRICIPQELRCDGQDDCVDNSDEDDCDLCTETSIRCPGGTCLPAEKKCDGQFDCSDGSDEPLSCGRICAMNNGGCSDVCTDQPWGVRCDCPAGYEISPNGVVCEDLDECAAPFPPCPHHCLNTAGSFNCHCKDGFKLSEASMCLASGSGTHLLMVQSSSIGLLNVKSQKFEVIQNSVFDPVALAFDINRQWFYWADRAGKIFKSEGQQSWTAFSGEPGIMGLACDWLNGNLFWTNRKTQSIYMQAADGKSYTTLSKNISPSELVLVPIESLMFWINMGPGDGETIEKSWMDGSDRSSVTVITAQSAHSLTADVAAGRLYWISEFKRSIESVLMDGTGRYSFTGVFNKRPALGLAVFESSFYWVDDRGLWQVTQRQPSQRKFLLKAELPLLAIYHELQQPKGSSACIKTRCKLCQLTKSNTAGYTCTCPNSKVLLPDGTCEFPRFVYNTITTVNLLEFRGKESSETQVFATKDGILSFDVDWSRGWLYWANQTGHIQRSSVNQDQTEVVPAPLPVCFITVDQKSGSLYWVSCDQNCIGTTNGTYQQRLYHTTNEIGDLHLDWLRGVMYWLEEGQRIFSMRVTRGKAEELLQIAGSFRETIAFDLRANSLLWNSNNGLITMSLLQERSHQAGRWNISGSVVAALEPYLLTVSHNVINLWDCRDGSLIQELTMKNRVLTVVAALAKIQTELSTPTCNSPSVLCRHSSMCISQAQRCDGMKDCPEGDDEEFCLRTCSPTENFRCKDGGRCISRKLVCDGRAHCFDGSDEVDCTTVVTPVTQTSAIKCRLGSKPCKDGRACVLYSHICDGERDCEDGSDELGCDALPPITTVANSKESQPDEPAPDADRPVQNVPACTRTDFLCKDRQSCVSKNEVCDGRSDCYDGSDEVDCPSVPVPALPKSTQTTLKCRLGSKLCQDGTECVLYSHVCDGETDCQDGSDEVGCDARQSANSGAEENSYLSNVPASNKPVTEHPTKPPCPYPSVLCPDSSVCLNANQICDGKKDCPDGSDEKCLQRCPYRTDFLCKNRQDCISESKVCDGQSDCLDGSDEFNCPSVSLPAPPKTTLRCRLGSRPCQDGTECVLYSHVCDGHKDCRDGSDEEGCEETTVENTSTGPSCRSPSVLCPGSAVCIIPAQLCDGKRDCPDGTDEDCVRKCADPTDFLCRDRRSCVSRSLVCDGRPHCHDGSDELDCSNGANAAPEGQALKCRIGSRLCDDGTECVLYSHLCDGEDDCLDGTDERGCPEICKQGEFRCSHGKKCIPEAQVCDGRSQCRDSSDEMNCWKPTKSCEHRCADGKRCIPKKFLCDGERDCMDGSDEMGCTLPVAGESGALAPTSVCVASSVLCPGSALCIQQEQLCDGQRDCPDGFDESNCVVQCENPNDFVCTDQRKCILRKEVCDGHLHCHDGSDERQCPSEKGPASSSNVPDGKSEPLKCRRGFKLCQDGLDCVMYSHICDGDKDCKDGSDELGCATKCKEGEFQCSHGVKCVPQDRVCDGRYDCQDWSDELDCSARGNSCHHHCDNKTRCIPATFLCDGEKDCADGSDEEKCDSSTCEKHQHRCASGQCVSEALRCDGYADCSDRSDEAYCARPPLCPEQLRCPHSHECLQKEWLCDGEEDCKDGSDEKNCNTPPAKCRTYQWQCRDSSQCIPLLWRCDGARDCDNGMDENKCKQRNCPSHLYQCDSGECIDPKLVCNLLSNCYDGSDEGVVCGQRNCSSPSAPRCDHQCVSTPSGPTCFCAAGFRPQSSTLACLDVDECNSEPQAGCKHTCLNSLGSHTCQCHPGFYLQPDNKSCKTKDEPLLLASVQSDLLLLGVHSGTLRKLTTVSRPVFSLDYHWALQRVYWLSPDYKSIRWADIKNPHNEGTLIKGVKSDFLAVDWVGQNLYWVDGLVGKILAVNLSETTLRSQDYTIVLGGDMEQPSSLVLVPHRGLMFWSEIGTTPQIERSGMDGSKRKVVVSSHLSWPVSLAYDLLDNRVYWADEKLRCIGSASPDGEHIKILQLAETPNPFSVVVFNDRVFWSDTKRRTIRSAAKNSGKGQKVLLKRPGQPFGLKVIHAISQPTISSPCEQLACSHLCLLAPPSEAAAVKGPVAVCRCPKGLLLSKDGITCVLPPESAFVLLLSRNTIYQIYLRSMRQDGVSLKKMPPSRGLALPETSEAVALDVSFRDLSLYVAFSGQGSVDVLRMSSSRSRQGLTSAGQMLQLKKGDFVTALAVDWVTFNLYWSSNQQPDIHVTSRYQSHTTSLLEGFLMGTTSIALHPPSGRLCFTAVSTVGRKSQTDVDCAWMDGRNKSVLWKSSIPTSLAFSNNGTMIYWADTGEGVINSIAVDGTGHKQFKTGPGLLISFTHTPNILLWVTLGKDVAKVWFTDGLQPNQLWFTTKTTLVEIKAYSKESQSGGNGCSRNNGDCDHLCLPYPGGRTCKCGRGFQSVNATLCVQLPSCPAGEESCFNSAKCLSSSKFCNGRVDCPDQSDEQDCLSSNSVSSGSKASDDHTLPSPSNTEKNNILPVKTDASCDVQRCNGNGKCIREGKVTRCQCLHGYKGESCQETDGGQSHVSVVLGIFFLIVGVAGGIFIFIKREKLAALKSRSADKENLMANVSLRPDDSGSDSEELESPVDLQNPPLPIE